MKSKQTQTPKREVRTLPSAARPMTVRTTADGSKQISGYAVVFSKASCDLGGFVEICHPNMLDRTLKESPDVLALRDHKQELLLGRTISKTLELHTDSTGLAFTITLPMTAIGDDTAENVRVGNLSGVSFGFSTVADSWDVGADGRVVRTLLDVDLFEISPTSFPAYADTSVSVRSCPAELKSKLTRSDDEYDEDQEDDEEAENDNGCECDCDNDCESCTNGECDDPECVGCPEQDDTRCDHLRVKRLFALRSN